MTASDPIRVRLTGLAKALRHLHAALLEHAKSDYEFLNGKIDGAFTLYNLVLNDPHFQWLRPLSGLMATLDEVIDSKEPLTTRHIQDVRTALGLLFGQTDARFADFRREYDRFREDSKVRDADARWREVLNALEA
ncbi:hypothetical protein [Deinococcus maricopensis]|uniref:Uncharacterized protein n=1 Tax=Deinococcus maricopensis (strain DSM 21211 / LMG 22137 / NRRL B-23946 / LB-34) TaxID=709986 RepID=E8UBF8_DEIML|nr:hypothetical protein [Deinococcus maricopensis]ADV68397.1 hypothetical protein Deima_2768 [Deinococcus maricopensis DSM 21211]